MSAYPMGLDLIQTGQCPQGGLTPLACMFCPYGHMTECHHPFTCEEAQCSHYEREMEAESGPDIVYPEEPPAMKGGSEA